MDRGTGLSDLWDTILHIYLASIGYAMLGTALAVVLRSPALALAVGVAYVLPVEAITVRFWHRGDRWLTGQAPELVGARRIEQRQLHARRRRSHRVSGSCRRGHACRLRTPRRLDAESRCGVCDRTGIWT